MSDRALAATTQVTVSIITGHTLECACDRCDELRFVRLPDEVQRLVAELAEAQERAHLRGFEVGREWRP